MQSKPHQEFIFFTSSLVIIEIQHCFLNYLGDFIFLFRCSIVQRCLDQPNESFHLLSPFLLGEKLDLCSVAHFFFLSAWSAQNERGSDTARQLCSLLMLTLEIKLTEKTRSSSVVRDSTCKRAFIIYICVCIWKNTWKELHVSSVFWRTLHKGHVPLALLVIKTYFAKKWWQFKFPLADY